MKSLLKYKIVANLNLIRFQKCYFARNSHKLNSKTVDSSPLKKNISKGKNKNKNKINNLNNPVDEQIDQNNSNDNKLKELLSIKSKKLGEPDLNSFILKEKVIGNNVVLLENHKYNLNKAMREINITKNDIKIAKKGKFLNPIQHKFRNSKNYKRILELIRIKKLNFKSKSTPIPYSPKLGPYEVLVTKNINNKNYHWCSCGLSKKQPFCDRSHQGSKFKPLNFQLAENTKSMLLCGCKLSTSVPFCDGVTCVKLAKKDQNKIEDKLKTIKFKSSEQECCKKSNSNTKNHSNTNTNTNTISH